MSVLNAIMAHNREFVERREYEPYQTSGLPKKKVIVVSCMDTRLTELLPKAMNLHNGDAKFLKTAGAIVKNPFGSIMRSIIVAVFELGAQEILIVGHHRCGMANLKSADIVNHMVERGISEDTVAILENAGIDLTKWLNGFDSVEESVQHSVRMMRNHPLLPTDVTISGLVIDPDTGKLDVVDAAESKSV